MTPRTLGAGSAPDLPRSHRQSVTVLTEEARRHSGGVHGDYRTVDGATAIDIEFPDLVEAAEYVRLIRDAFRVAADLRDPASSVWSTTVITVRITDAAHREILRHLT